MSDKSFADLEVLLNKVSDKEIKQYTEEAINCYYAKSYRAAIISIWIAIVLDLYKKMESIHNDFHDPGAKEFFEEVKSARESGKASDWEKCVLYYAFEKVKLINKEQYERLERIEKDRHKCAHPVLDDEDILYQPTSEETRAHIRNAIDIVLSQQTIFGKNFAETILEKIESPYVSSDKESIEAQIKEKYIDNSNNVFRKNLIKLLLKKIVKFDIEITKKNHKKYINTLLILEDRSEVDFAEIKSDLINILESTPDSHIEYLIYLIGKVYNIGIFCPIALLNKMCEYSIKHDNLSLKFNLLQHSSKIFEHISKEYLRLIEPHQISLINIVKQCRLTERVEFHSLINNCIYHFLESGSFDIADHYAQCLSPLVEFLSKENVEEIILKSPENRGGYGRCNQLRTNEDIFIEIYQVTKDKYPDLQEKWEKHSDYFINDFDRLNWVVNGNNLEDYIDNYGDLEDEE